MKRKPKLKVKRVALGKGYLFFTKDDHGCELSDGSAMWQGHPFGALIKLRNLGNPKIRLVAEIIEEQSK